MKNLNILILSILCFSNSLSYSHDWQQLYDSTLYYFNKNKIKTALDWGQKAQQQAEKEFGKYSIQYHKTIFQLIDLNYYINDLKKTFEIAKLDSEVCFRTFGVKNPNYYASLNNLAIIYGAIKGDYSQSQVVFQNSIKIQNSIEPRNDSAYAFTIGGLAWCYENLSKFTLAEPLYKNALSIIHKIHAEDDYTYGETLHNLGALYKRMGFYEKADSMYHRALDVNKKLKGAEHPDIATEYDNIAELYKLMGRYNEAEPLYKKALVLRKKIYGVNHIDYAKSLNNLALFYFSMGRYKQAEKLYTESIEIKKKKLGVNHQDYAVSLNNLALLYEDTKRYKEALPLFNEVLRIYRKKYGEKHPFYATGLDNLAMLYQKMGNVLKAEELFKQAIKIRGIALGKDHPKYAKSLYNLASLYELMNEYKKSEPLFLEALKLRKDKLGEDHPDYAKNLIGLAVLYDNWKKYPEAEKYYLLGLSKYLNQIKRYFPYLSEKEKLEFWIKVRKPFEDFDNFVVNYHNTKPEIINYMYNNILISKGLILSSTKKVIRKIRQSNDSNVISILDRWEKTKSYWLWLIQHQGKHHINIDSVADIANSLEKELSKTSDDFKKAFKSKAPTWLDVRKSLAESEAAIEIVRFVDNKNTDSENNSIKVYYAALITKYNSINHPDLVVLNNGRELENKYVKLYGNLVKILKIQPIKQRTSLEIELMKSDQNLLYKMFWEQIQKKLNGIKAVYLSVDGVYNSINLLTFRNPKTEKYLLDELDLRIVTNTKDLVEYTRNKEHNTKDFIDLFGDPKYNLNPKLPDRISELPGTKIEIEKILKMMIAKDWTVDEYLGKKALERTVKSINNPTILHIATHGVFLKNIEQGKPNLLGTSGKHFVENPLLRSMLLFAGAENNENNSNTTNDGKLTAYEAMNLNLDNTDLVVLSACETGLGEIQNGEGVYGLQRAFQVAGTKSLIMSLWTVSDDATQKLMTTFYQKMLNGESKRIAFRETQIELKKTYPEFYYWGAFVMIGQ